ncbi:zinc finger protein 532 [Osmerus eperlanus]|uniref:zinc finger protein 532 n=1 Tax=Osmerus eperlanus TaxID=29151 RepID=UPI002E0F129D
MGDVKTPDFDDLLAAFDIPDMVDPKAAIELSHDDQKPSIPQENEAHTPPSGPDVGISVIVKNIRNLDASQHAQLEKEVHFHATIGNGLHNGIPAMSPINRYGMNGADKPSSQVGGCSQADRNPSTFNQFSPISSAEEFDDDDDKTEMDEPMDQQKSHILFCPAQDPIKVPLIKRENQTKITTLTDSLANPGSNGNCDQSKVNKNNKNNGSLSCFTLQDSLKTRKVEAQAEDLVVKSMEVREPGDHSGQAALSTFSQDKAKASAKLSDCMAAIAALSAKVPADTGLSESFSMQRESQAPQMVPPKEGREDTRVPETLTEQESPLEVAKMLLVKQPDSPLNIPSEGGSKGSPSSPTGCTPVIPKVRIKTIKTSSGQIKRTVTRVLPEFDPMFLKKGENNASIVVSSILSSPISTSIFSTQARTSLPATIVASSAGPTMEITKQMTIKPVATAFLPVSAVKTAGSQVINLKLANNTTVKATVVPASSVQSASSAILKTANAIQQQAVIVPTSSLANAKLIPKTVHLTNLNLLPQTALATEFHQVLSKPLQQQPITQAILAAQGQTQVPRKLSRIQVLASSQSSMVEAFNKVLSSINPVPVYVPNLSPPSLACISLPSRGYKCLECGDSFALEKSLTQHYDRRSVRIEVTCNHCTKNLVFYNKCSLLSHARGHKDKGVAMQCSHLILKPIPADQMITVSFSPASTRISTLAQCSTGQLPGKGLQAAGISAPSGTPQVAAMPLEDDTTRLCRHSLKCLECSEVFQEESSLALHYQQPLESCRQKTCTICQMLLPNQCSFTSHQRIHQHKSPYICPECGAICRSVHFQSHVTKNCLHYTRRVGYRCVHCSVIYTDVAALKAHLQSTHCEIFYKCPICPMAFKSAQGTHSHAYTQHPGIKIGESKLIYKCSMCDTVFTQQALLYSHFDHHLASQKVSVFKCPDCSMHYVRKQLMLDHIKAMHGTLKSIEGPPNLGINRPLNTKPTKPLSASPNNREGPGLNGMDSRDKKQPSSSSPIKKPLAPGWKCTQCERLFPQREVFVAHMRREHGKHLKKHPCPQCDKSFSSSHSLCRHNRIKHKGLRKIYSCPHGPDLHQTFTKRLMLDKHIQLVHDIKGSEGKSSRDHENLEDAPEKAPSPKRNQEEDEGSPDVLSRGSEAQPLKKLKVNVFKDRTCAVCGFTTEEVDAFRGHIPQHKSDRSSFQCRECGLCYTSHPSLARHLFIIHRVKEPHSLARRYGALEDDESQQENQLGPSNSNADGTPETKCKVCGKMFETEGSLNTHMRTHGMAFIKSKRLSMAEK